MTSAVQVLQNAGQAAALLQPGRLKLMEALREPSSAASLARLLGEPRQRINYHLRELEGQGLVELVEERRKGNCVERVLRATAHSYVISPSALGPLGSSTATGQDRFSCAALITAAARIIRDLTVLRGRADRAGKSHATLSIETEVRFANPSDRNAFTEELASCLAKLAARYHAPEGRLFRFVFGGYPAITKQEEETHADAVRMN
jgi:DNA-binding transcriptional ArsR family regulator